MFVIVKLVKPLFFDLDIDVYKKGLKQQLC